MMKEFLKQDDWKRRFKYNAPVDAELNAKIAVSTVDSREWNILSYHRLV